MNKMYPILFPDLFQNYIVIIVVVNFFVQILYFSNMIDFYDSNKFSILVSAFYIFCVMRQIILQKFK